MLENPKKVKNDLVKWIKDYFKDTSDIPANAVIGISGGKDSYIAAALCKEALGADRVIGLLMPNGDQADIADSLETVNDLGIKYHIINIKDTYGAMVAEMESTGVNIHPQTLVNIAPRVRMATLYAYAASVNGRVVNTCNLSEDFVGYSTKYGDGTGDFSVFKSLLVSEVIQIGDELGLIDKLVHKTPSDGLCGKTDEDNFGFTYADIEAMITTGTSGNEETDKLIKARRNANLHKELPMPKFHLDAIDTYHLD